MSLNGKQTPDEVNSPWTLDISPQGVRRVRNTSTADGVPSLPMEKKLRNVFVGFAGGAEMLGDEFSANAIESKSEELAYGWALLAQENERVRTAVSWLLETSAWGEAIIPTAMLGGMIAWHYGLVPDKFGIPLVQLSGTVPISREQEIHLQRMAQAEAQKEAEANAQAEAAAAADEFTHTQPDPESGPDITGDGDTPSVVQVPRGHAS